MEEVRNLFGTMVRRCCASCQHKCIITGGKRLCATMMLTVDHNFVCNQWEMSDGMKNAGLGGGVVRLKGSLEEILNNDH